MAHTNFRTSFGSSPIMFGRSTDGGETWEAPVQVNEDPGARHHIFPTIDVSNGALHVAWYDFRNNTTAANEALDVYYASATRLVTHIQRSATTNV